MKIAKNTAKNLVINHVEIWNESGVEKDCFVEVSNGAVKKIGKSSSKAAAEQSIDGKGAILIPAGVDPQVHTRVPGQLQKESAESSLESAVAGGIAALLTMPNTKPVLDDVSSMQLANEQFSSASDYSGVRVLLSVAITKGQKGQESVDFDRLAEAGAVAYTDDGVGVVDDQRMRDVYMASERSGLPILQHAEMPGHGAVLAKGPLQTGLELKPYPRSAEIDMVARDLKLLSEYPQARYHVLHVSCRETLDLIQSAKAKGLNATCEVSPHHLYLSSADIEKGKTSYKMNPPLRDPADGLALRRALQDGQIDFVATDHAPHEPTFKGDNFKNAAFGTTGMETSLRVLLALHKRGELSSERLVEVFSSAPARFLGVSDEYGSIAEGKPFRAVLVGDHQNTYTVTEDDLASQSKNCCFLGHSLPGQIKNTFIDQFIFELKRSC
ncbi:dihydroorotase [Oligoflexaceae bacterium]|nr:dihydroorotase [Oligoflexaceae bacterium]